MNAFYKSYTDIFLTGLSDYARVTASASTQSAEVGYVTISQRLNVDGTPLIVALGACVDSFYALASGYSGVSLDGMDELAMDAVGELFNVINGHFSSHMSAHGCTVSIIDPPRHCHGAAEPEPMEFSHFIASPIGTLRLMAAHAEFLAAEPHGST